MTDSYRTIKLESTDSTNTYAREMAFNPGEDTPFVIITDNQTHGRGQRGTTWESEPGRNLTFSLVVRPEGLEPARQFELSMLVSLGICEALRDKVEEPHKLRIKWPNDIYYGDRKLAGILIENTLGLNGIEKAIIGIGLNVNQTEFLSDAPNPISLAQIGGHEFERGCILDKVVSTILKNVARYLANPFPGELTHSYNSQLWRAENGKYYNWRDEKIGKKIRASIVSVNPDGRLNMQDDKGVERTYLFKEISAIL